MHSEVIEVIYQAALKLARVLEVRGISFHTWRALLRNGNRGIECNPHLAPLLHDLLLALEPYKPTIGILVQQHLRQWITARNIGWHNASVSYRTEALVMVVIECAWRNLPRVADHYDKKQAKQEFIEEYDDQVRALVRLVVNALVFELEHLAQNDRHYGPHILEHHRQRVNVDEVERREADRIRRALNRIIAHIYVRIVRATTFWPMPTRDTP